MLALGKITWVGNHVPNDNETALELQCPLITMFTFSTFNTPGRCKSLTILDSPLVTHNFVDPTLGVTQFRAHFLEIRVSAIRIGLTYVSAVHGCDSEGGSPLSPWSDLTGDFALFGPKARMI
jgi:hypothetical protein